MIPMMTTPHPSPDHVEMGSVVTVTVVNAANVFKDIREFITNIFGGRMERYEFLIEDATNRGMALLAEKAAREGYDGIVGLRITSPTVTQGGAELIIYGTGYRNRPTAAD